MTEDPALMGAAKWDVYMQESKFRIEGELIYVGDQLGSTIERSQITKIVFRQVPTITYDNQYLIVYTQKNQYWFSEDLIGYAELYKRIQEWFRDLRLVNKVDPFADIEIQMYP